MKGRPNTARGGLVFATLIAAISLQSCVSNNIDVQTPSFASLADGVYRGSYNGGLVKATVDATMASGRIEKVTIVSHRCGKGQASRGYRERRREEPKS